jgi:hypothetical protein
MAQRELQPGAPEQEHAIRDSAAHVVQAFLLGDGVWPLVEPSMADLPEIATVTDQLKALSDDPDKKHGGEAEIIVLAARAAAADGQKHMLLANDGGASIVAHRRGIATRHIGDVLAEFACADRGFKPDQCFAAYTAALILSAPPANSRPGGVEAFTCIRAEGACISCERREARKA